MIYLYSILFISLLSASLCLRGFALIITPVSKDKKARASWPEFCEMPARRWHVFTRYTIAAFLAFKLAWTLRWLLPESKGEETDGKILFKKWTSQRRSSKVSRWPLCSPWWGAAAALLQVCALLSTLTISYDL